MSLRYSLKLSFPGCKMVTRHYQSRVGCYLLDKPSLVMLEITMTSFGATAPLVVKNKIENEPTAAAAAPLHHTECTDYPGPSEQVGKCLSKSSFNPLIF